MDTNTMLAFVLNGPNDFSISRLPIPSPEPGEVLIRVRAAGLCGSDLPRIMETGAHRHPLVPGHEFAGEVVETGDGVDEDLIGIRAAVYPLIPCRQCRWCQQGMYNFCDNYDYLGSRRDGAFAEYVCAPADNLVPMPDQVSFEQAALTEPASVAYHGLKRVKVEQGNSVVIFGAGPIGLVLCQMARIMGASAIWVVDLVDEKLQLARQHNWANTVDASEIDVVEFIKEHFPHGAEVVIDAVGVPVVIPQAIQVASKNGRTLLLGNPHGDVTLPQELLSIVLRHELRFIGTWNSLPEQDWKQVLKWMESGAIQLEPLISHKIELSDLPAVIQDMHARRMVYEKVLVK